MFSAVISKAFLRTPWIGGYGESMTVVVVMTCHQLFSFSHLGRRAHFTVLYVIRKYKTQYSAIF
jgi:hypothetical protein